MRIESFWPSVGVPLGIANVALVASAVTLYWSDESPVGVIVAAEVVVPMRGVTRLLVNVSVPAKVAKVPDIGSVTEVLAVAVNVVVNAPDVVKLPPSDKLPVPNVNEEPEPVVVNSVPVVGNVKVVLAVAVNVVVNAPDVVKLPPSDKLPVPNVKLEPEPVVVNSVPVVGNVKVVLADTVNAVVNAPVKVKLPPMVIVLPVLATPVPPFAPKTIPVTFPAVAAFKLAT